MLKLSLALASVLLSLLPSVFASESLDAGLRKAQQVMMKATQNQEATNDSAMQSMVQELSSALSGKIQLVRESGEPCRKRFAWVDGKDSQLWDNEQRVVIHVCPQLIRHSDVYIAQTLIHESSHALFHASEEAATYVEMMAMYLGGESPRWSGYIDFYEKDRKSQYSGGSQNNQGFEYLKKIGIVSKIDYAAWKWALGMMGDIPLATIQNAWQKQSEHFTAEELNQILNHSNSSGVTCLMGAAREGAMAQVKFLLSLPGIRTDLKDREGRTAKQIAQQYGYPEMAELL